MDAGTLAIVEQLKDSTEPQDQILVLIFKTGEGNKTEIAVTRSEVSHQGQRLNTIEGQLKRIIATQQATETLQPAKSFSSLRQAIKGHSWAIVGVGIVAVVAFGLHFVVLNPDLLK